MNDRRKQDKIEKQIDLFQKEWLKIVNEEEKKYEAERKKETIRLHEEREKYLASLEPITLNEFLARFQKLKERYKNVLQYKKNENILFCSLTFNIQEILKNAQNASDLELAEIIDKAEKKMTDLESIKDIISNTNFIIEQKAKQKN